MASRSLLAADPRLVDALVEAEGRPTICKMRVIAGNQQVVRLDDETAAPADAVEQAALVAAVEAALPGCAALLLSDYAKGVLAPTVVAAAIEAAKRQGIPVLADPKSEDFGLYRGAVLLRLSGVYGPGRERLVDQVRSGNARLAPGTSPHTNRIHRDDAARALVHLASVEDPAPTYLGTDDEPVKAYDAARADLGRRGAHRAVGPQSGQSSSRGTSMWYWWSQTARFQ